MGTTIALQARAALELRRRQGALAVPAQCDRYGFRGDNLRALNDHTSAALLLAGPAGTGKTVTLLTKVHRALVANPGARVLMVRKTRASLSETAAQIYEDHVLGTTNNIHHGGAQRSHRQFYEYPNRSRLVMGGLDKPTRILSAEYDMIYIPEATEVSAHDVEILRTRLRAGTVAQEQLIMDCNPAHPTHWLKKAADAQEIAFYQSRHEDNPVLFDANGDLTDRGARYMATLDALTGVLHKRLRLGMWVQHEGAIYDNFSQHNITEEAEYDPAKGAIYWGCDDGYARGAGPGSASYHARVVLLAQMNSLGGFDIFAQDYATGEVHDATLDRLLGRADDPADSGYGYPPPQVAYIDQSAPYFREALWKRGITTIKGNDSARYNVSNGIRNVRRLICNGDGVRLLRIHPRCAHGETSLIAELQSYSYDPASRQSSAGEPKPLKVDDHGPDALRYLSRHIWHTG